MNREDDRKIRKVKQLKLPIYTFDAVLDRALKGQGVDTDEMFQHDQSLEEVLRERDLGLYEYLESAGLIVEED